MSVDIGRINCCGSCTVNSAWKCINYHGICRLYYIHSGLGGYYLNGKKCNFTSGLLYFFPYSAEFRPYSDDRDPLFHTYVDFEPIPPIVHSSPIVFDPQSTAMSRAALESFIAGSQLVYDGKKPKTPIDDFRKSGEPFKLFCASVTYLVSAAAEAVGANAVTDSAVVAAIDIMQNRMDGKISISDLAAASFMTTDSFIRRFSRVMGVTPYAYLKSLRIRTALYMRDAGESLDEIAMKTGYADSASLLHAMREAKDTKKP